MTVEIINDAICNNPSILIDDLDLEGEIYNEKFSSYCCIHNGDNPHGMSVYFNDYGSVRGRWVCHTNNCQYVFKNSLVGWVRGILSNRHCNWSKKGDKVYGWNDTLRYLKGLYNIDGESKIDPAQRERNNFIRQCHCVEEPKKNYLCSLDKYLRIYTSPPQYFRDQGFSDEVLEKYHVRYCDRPNSDNYRRCLVPVLDNENRNVIGVTARATYESKIRWLYNLGFPAGTNLYNYSFAADYIKRSKTAIIVESPKNVWWLEQAGIHNSVCIWSATGWNEYKCRLLDKLGIMKLVLALDNDEAGEAGSKKVWDEAKRFYNIVDLRLPPGVNDVADLSIDEFKRLFKGIS